MLRHWSLSGNGILVSGRHWRFGIPAALVGYTGLVELKGNTSRGEEYSAVLLICRTATRTLAHTQSGSCWVFCFASPALHSMQRKHLVIIFTQSQTTDNRCFWEKCHSHNDHSRLHPVRLASMQQDSATPCSRGLKSVPITSTSIHDKPAARPFERHPACVYAVSKDHASGKHSCLLRESALNFKVPA
jgi:hypothetical protein